MSSSLAKNMNRILRILGYEIRRADRWHLSLEAALLRMSARPVEIRTVIDVGASDGRWSDKVRKFFPDATYFLIEANIFHEEKLKQVARKYANTSYVIAAAGDTEEGLHFDGSDPFGGIASDAPKEGYALVPSSTIDALVATYELQPPFLIKLDTHGFESPILAGAATTLQQTNLIIMETYNFQLMDGSLRFYEICSLLDSKGFRPIDIIEPMHRPKDNALWQMDFCFVPADRREFQNNRFE